MATSAWSCKQRLIDELVMCGNSNTAIVQLSKLKFSTSGVSSFLLTLCTLLPVGLQCWRPASSAVRGLVQALQLRAATLCRQCAGQEQEGHQGLLLTHQSKPHRCC